MKAIIYTKFGAPEVLEIKEVEKPRPKAHQVLIKIHATTVTSGDIRMRSFIVPRGMGLMAHMYLGFKKPKRPILGMELAGEIEAVGSEVTKFKIGDQVFASTFDENMGGYSEYKCFSENGIIAIKPRLLSFEEAAAVPGGGLTALHNIRKAKIQRGQKVLIYGASGSTGTYAVQLAKYFGGEVTGVCSTKNLNLVKTLGADRVIDYTKEDLTQQGLQYDVIFDAVSKLPPKIGQKLLKKTGVYLDIHKTSGKLKVEQLNFLKDLIIEGKLKPVIDRTYPFEDIIEAHKYVEKGHKKGNVVVKIC
ncbi:NAD-dependent alcohol dehydrogenase [Candidatus Lokiarchaeum ossiferum]|uniref:NAD-dependent alcohol dehydrogenase n=1 Tax=Candidatus Lokiarchaeum ossiferum TaxID=2951803 RepID=A0ABY6HLL9_9ARCH|nr:NAD-dependent alcohol dehydrogenase [Candidatus Lokiarchaeum sp. B-35]